MPELPEVEVLRRSLLPLVRGRTIESIEVWNGDLRERVHRRRLTRLAGHKVVDIRRRAKYLWLDTANGQTLVIHLGLSGRLTLVPTAEPRELHEHVGIFLDDGQRLRFRDPRRFGLVFAQASDRLPGDRHFEHLGLEPLAGEMTGAVLYLVSEAASYTTGTCITCDGGLLA